MSSLKRHASFLLQLSRWAWVVPNLTTCCLKNVDHSLSISGSEPSVSNLAQASVFLCTCMAIDLGKHFQRLLCGFWYFSSVCSMQNFSTLPFALLSPDPDFKFYSSPDSQTLNMFLLPLRLLNSARISTCLCYCRKQILSQNVTLCIHQLTCFLIKWFPGLNSLCPRPEQLLFSM